MSVQKNRFQKFLGASAALTLLGFLSSCQGELSTTTELLKKCKTNLNDEACNSSDSDVTMSGDSITVTFTKPKVQSRVTVVGGKLDGLVITIPPKSFKKSLTLTADYSSGLGFNLASVKSLLGLSTTLPSVKINWSDDVSNNLLVQLPSALTVDYSLDEMKVSRVKVTTLESPFSVTRIPNDDLGLAAKSVTLSIIEPADYSVEADITPPTATMTSTADPTISTPFPVVIQFSEAVSDFSTTSLKLSNASITNFVASGNTVSFTMNPLVSGVSSATLSVGSFQDTFGNKNTKSATISRLYSIAKPSVVLSSTSPNITNASPFTVTATFSTAVTGFDMSDLSSLNGVISNFSGSGAVYTFDVTPSSQGLVTVSLGADKAQNSSGNQNTAALDLMRTFDSTIPSVVLSSTAPGTTNISPIPVDIVFSEVVTGLTLSDFVVANGVASNLVGSGTTYTVDITPSSNGLVTVDLPLGSATDSANNGNAAAVQLSRTYNNLQPSVVLTTSASAQTASTPIPVTATFSAAVTGFVVGDVSATNGTVAGFAGSGTTYTFNVTPSGQGAVTVNVAANVAQDVSSNQNTASNTLSVTYDTVAPTIVISTSASSVTNTSPIPVTFTFSESVTGFVAGDVTVGNGTLAGFAGSGTTYTANITPSGQGTVTVDVSSSVAQDGAGNNNSAATQLSRTYDSVVPTVIISSTAPATTSTSPIPVTVTFSESVTGFVVGDLTISNGTASGFSGSGTTYTVNITPSGQGNVTVDVAGSVAQDTAGNNNSAATQLTRLFDSSSPTVVISTTAPSITNTTPIPVTVTFSESVTGFVVGDLTIGNGIASGFSGSGTTYTVNVTPSGQGVVTVDVNAGVAQDVSANNNTAATQLSRTFDSVAPSVVLSSTAPTVTATSPIPVTATFSESVTGFALSDISVSGGTASNLSGSGTTYTFDVTPSGQGAVLIDVPSNGAVDTAGNNNTAATQLSRTFDTSGPTVVVSSTAPAITNASPIPFTATFSESVTGFVVGDLTITNGTASGFSGSGTTYTFNVTPSGQGVVSVDINAGVAQDAGANTNSAATQVSRTFDSVVPTVVISSTAPSTTNTSPIPVTITFSESVTGFVVGDITVGNGSAGNFSGSGTTYTADITPSANGVVTVNVAGSVAQDAATNNNTAATQLSRTYSNSQPSLVLSTTAPANTNTSPIPVTATFSASVTGFVVGDVDVTNGSISGFSGSGTTYTFDVTPSGQGAVTVGVQANRAQDVATNGNTASNTLSVTYDNVAPTVVISSSAGVVTSTTPIPVTITFSESVTGFVVGDLTLSNGTASGFSGSGTTYNVNITPTGQGVVTVNVAANVAQDASSNNNTAATQLSRTFDSAAPTVTISSTAPNPTNTSPIPVTVTFSESVTGFVVGDIVVGNGTASGFSGSGTTYTLNVTPTAQGSVTVDVAANVAVDTAGNNNTVATQLVRLYDTAAPTVTISSSASAITPTSPIPVTVTFSESVVGFTIGDLTIGNGTAGSFSGSGTTYNFNVTPSGQGAVTVDVAANVAQDASGNNNTAATQLSRTFDSVAPTVVISSTAPTNTNVSPIPVTITFSESVTGFVVGDLTIGNGTAGGFSGSGTTYTVNVTPSANGLVTVNVAGSVAQDAATNNNTAATQLSRTFNNTQPSLVLSTTAPSNTNTSPIPVTATFSASVTGFDVSDIDVTNGTAGSFSGSGTTYTYTITPSGQGTVSTSVLANRAQDAATNNNTASNTLSVTFDNVAPTVSITSTASAVTSTSPIPVTITFSESVTGFVVGDITPSNGTLSGFSGSGTTYTVNVTPSGQGIVTVNVAGSVAQDVASNNNSAATQLSRTFDTAGPTVTISSTAPATTNTSPIPITITFSESVAGLVLGDITIGNGIGSGLSGSGATYTLNVTPSSQGTVTVDLGAGVTTDGAGNNNTAAT